MPCVVRAESRYSGVFAFVTDVGFVHEHTRHVRFVVTVKQAAKRALVFDGEEHDGVGLLLPLAGFVGVVRSELECCVNRLCRLESDR